MKRPQDKYYPKKEQGITEDHEEDIYTEDERDRLMEDDEISPTEEAFMEGAEGRGEQAKCARCGKVLSQDPSEVHEKEYDDELMFFCSEKCADAGPQK